MGQHYRRASICWLPAAARTTVLLLAGDQASVTPHGWLDIRVLPAPR